jgi:hypothetical protein
MELKEIILSIFFIILNLSTLLQTCFRTTHSSPLAPHL